MKHIMMHISSSSCTSFDWVEPLLATVGRLSPRPRKGRGLKIPRFGAALAMVCLCAYAFATHAATIWNGPAIVFIKQDSTDATQPANQDRITPNVWLTRGGTEGLFNAKTEMGYASASPADTEWAYGTTADYASLQYKPWVEWHQHR